jgi:hypothetical protein
LPLFVPGNFPDSEQTLIRLDLAQFAQLRPQWAFSKPRAEKNNALHMGYSYGTHAASAG